MSSCRFIRYGAVNFPQEVAHSQWGSDSRWSSGSIGSAAINRSVGFWSILALACSWALGPSWVGAESIRVGVENLQPADGFFFTPVWVGFHDGSFDLFDPGAAASDPLEVIAEEGNPGPLSSLFLSAMNGDGSARYDHVLTAPGGFEGAPVFDPGEKITMDLDVPMASSNQYLSFASMAIPSNDAFIGNMDPQAFRVFNADGSFAGPLTIELFGSSIHDAGTESNTGQGAAFSTIGGTGEDEGGVVLATHPGLDNFVGTMTAAGTTIGSAVAGDEPFARIQVTLVPEPGSLALALMGMITASFALRRKRPSA
jgi:hypothetical protein